MQCKEASCVTQFSPSLHVGKIVHLWDMRPRSNLIIVISCQVPTSSVRRAILNGDNNDKVRNIPFIRISPVSHDGSLSFEKQPPMLQAKHFKRCEICWSSSCLQVLNLYIGLWIRFYRLACMILCLYGRRQK